MRYVGVKDSRVVAVSKDKRLGGETIDAKDDVVAPSFVDTHDDNTATPFGRKLVLLRLYAKDSVEPAGAVIWKA